MKIFLFFRKQDRKKISPQTNRTSNSALPKKKSRQRCIGVYDEQVHAFLSMYESTIAAAKALAKAIIDNGDLEEIKIYNLTENLTDFLEDYEED